MWGIYILLISYFLLWAGLLIHCLVRKRFYPMLKSNQATRVFWLATFLFFNPILLLLYLILGVLARPKDPAETAHWFRAMVIVLVAAVVLWELWPTDEDDSAVVRFIRDAETGEMVTGTDLPDGDEGMHLTATNTQSNFSWIASASSHDGDALACSRAVMLNYSDQPVMKLIGVLTAHSLSNTGWFDELVYYPAGQYPGVVDPGADMFITLNGFHFHETGLPGNKTLEGTVLITAGRKPWFRSIGGSHTRSQISIPIADLDMKGTMQFTSVISGLAASDKRQQIWAEKLSEEIAGKLNDQLAQWGEKYRPLADLPAGFRPTYRPASDVPFAAKPNCKQILSQNWLLRPNETFWQLEDDREVTAVLTDLREELLSVGWEDDGRLKLQDGGYDTTLRMKKDHRRLWAFRRSPQDCGLPGEAMDATHGMPSSPHNNEPDRPVSLYYIGYIEEVDEATRCRVLEELLAGEVSTDRIVQFHRMAGWCSKDLEDRFFEQLDCESVGSVHGLVELAYYHQGQGDIEVARLAARKARVLSIIREGKPDASLKKLAEKLDDPTLIDKELTVDDLIGAGIPQLEPPDYRLTVPADLGETVRAAWFGPEGPVILSAGTMRTIDQEGNRYKIQMQARNTEGDAVLSATVARKIAGFQNGGGVGIDHASFSALVQENDTGEKDYLITISKTKYATGN